jgi:GntR family transcriptional regulator
MTTPRWREIADDLRQKIESGELGRDRGQLPTEVELQRVYRVSRNTVRDAIKWLVSRGLVYTRSGRGTFVRHSPVPFVTRFGSDLKSGLAESKAFEVAVRDKLRTPQVSDPTIVILQAHEPVGRYLRLPPDAAVISRHQRRLIDGVPYSLQTTYYPMSLVTAGALRLAQPEDIDEGAVAHIQDSVGVVQAGWADRITVRSPDPDEAEFFRLPDDGSIAVFEVVRIGFDRTSQPFRVTITVYPGDRNRFVLETGQVPDDAFGDADVTTAPAENHQ